VLLSRQRSSATLQAILSDYAKHWSKGPIDTAEMGKSSAPWVSELHRLKLDKIGNLDSGEIQRLPPASI
jgi:hypothetical protein